MLPSWLHSCKWMAYLPTELETLQTQDLLGSILVADCTVEERPNPGRQLPALGAQRSSPRQDRHAPWCITGHC